mmetsp:Transcript_22195/g.33814  ORF Transcript_22195/g.33814 Transcript_22195/m.33814 type:complete len:1088 (-) Transcript_22195:54-3317(-)
MSNPYTEACSTLDTPKVDVPHLDIDHPSIAGMTQEEAFKSCFPVGSVFADKATLVKAVKYLSAKYHTVTSIANTTKIICACGGIAQRTSSGKRKTAPSLKCGCPFEIRFKGQCINRNYRFDEGDAVTITKKTNVKHTCEPSIQKYLALERKSGGNVKKLNTNARYELCAMLADNPRTGARDIRRFLDRIAPNKATHWTANQIWNLRISILAMIKKMDNEAMGSYDSFKLQFVDEEFQSIINCTSGLNIVTDEASAAAKDIWFQVMNQSSSNNDRDKASLLLTYLNEMKSMYDGFDFRISYDICDRITGVCWMTAVMRGSLEKFGSYITLDAMKHELNNLHWPYFAPALMREDGTICVACEAIAISECHDAYIFVVDSMYEMAPNARRDEVLIVSADGVMGEKFIREKLQLPNANFIEDVWHLLNSVLPNTFGKFKFSQMKYDVENMIRSKSETEFQRLTQVVRNHISTNADHLRKFHELLQRKKHYAHHIISTLPGCMNVQGSTPSEQNHSSVKSHLGRDYFASADCLARDLLHRQNYLSLERSKKLFEYSQRLKYCHSTLSVNEEQLMAASNGGLNYHGYKMWEHEYDVAMRKKEFIMNTSITSKSCSLSWCKGHTHMIQCRHMICANNMKFSKAECAPRWHYTGSVEKSHRAGVTHSMTVLCPSPSDHTTNHSSTSADNNIAMESSLECDTQTQSRPLVTFNKLSELCREVVEFTCRSNNDTKEMIGGLLVSLKIIAKNNGSMSGIGDIIDGNANAQTQLTSLWTSHSSRFGIGARIGKPTSSTRQIFSSNSSSTMIATRKTKRPQSMQEKLQTKHKKKSSSSSSRHSFEPTCNIQFAAGKKTSRSCSFCKESGHTIIKCPKVKSYGSTVTDLTCFRLHITKKYPIGHVVLPKQVTKDIHKLTRAQFKHLQVHSIHPKQRMEQHQVFGSVSEAILGVSLVDDTGNINENFGRIFVDGGDFDQTIVDISKTDARFLFDNITLSSAGTNFQTRYYTDLEQGRSIFGGPEGSSFEMGNYPPHQHQTVRYPLNQLSPFVGNYQSGGSNIVYSSSQQPTSHNPQMHTGNDMASNNNNEWDELADNKSSFI